MAGKLKPKAKKQKEVERRTRVPTESPVQRLKRREHINVYEHTAADEIVAAYHISVGAPVSRDADLGIEQGLRPGLADNAAAKRVDIVDAYQRWKADLAGTRLLAVTNAVLFQERDPRALDTFYHWRRDTARGHLIAALRHYSALRGSTPRGACGWRYVDNPAAC